MSHSLSVAIISKQRQKFVIFTQVYNMLRQLPPSHESGQRMEMYLKHETGSLSCHRLMKPVKAWLFIPEV